MKFEVSRDQLLGILSANLGILEKKSTAPLLQYLYCEVDETGKLTTKSTNFDISLSTENAVQVLMPGKILLPCKNLHDIVKELPADKPIVFSKLDNDFISIQCEHIFFRLPALSHTHFPAFPVVSGEFFSIKSAVFKNMIDRVFFASSVDPTRQQLHGLYLHRTPHASAESMRLVATDAHRLALVDMTLEQALPESWQKGVILHRKGLQELRKLLDTAPEHIELALLDTQMIARLGTTLLFFRLIEGEFPEYEMVIPRENDKVFTVNRMVLFNAIRRISVLPNFSPTAKARPLQIRITDGSLVISCESPEFGEGREVVEIGYEGPAVEIGFNGKYFLDALGACTGDVVKVKMMDELTAALLVDGALETYVNVIMPIRV